MNGLGRLLAAVGFILVGYALGAYGYVPSWLRSANATQPHTLYKGMTISFHGEARTIDQVYYLAAEDTILLVIYHTYQGRAWATGAEWAVFAQSSM